MEGCPSFIDSKFCTKAAYEAACASPDFAAAEAAHVEAMLHKHRENQFVGQIVLLGGLKSRADLNGKKGRAVKYDAATGRVGVSIKTVTKLGAIERSVMALQPANLTVVPQAPQGAELEEDAELTPDPANPDSGLNEVSWDNLMRSLGLLHLRAIHWSRFEEAICTRLMCFRPRLPDRKGALQVLEEEAGVTSPPERERIVDALLGPAWVHGMAAKPKTEEAPAATGGKGGKGGKGGGEGGSSSGEGSGEGSGGEGGSGEGEGEGECEESDVDAMLSMMGESDPTERQKAKDAAAKARKQAPDPMIASLVLKLFSARVKREEVKNDAKFAPQRQERQEKTKGVPTADSTFSASFGRVCDQRRGTIDDSDVARPPPEKRKGAKAGESSPVVYPTSQQVDMFAGLMRGKVRTMACVGSGERLLEGMLERRGVEVIALDADTFKEADDYYEKRIYCSQVRRIGIGNLMRFTAPQTICLVFVYSVLAPWEAYLARYPEIPYVIVIGDDESKKLYQPKPKDLERFPGLKLMHKMPIDCYRSPPITCSFFERVPLSGGSS
jgi:uncharacterized membrane protein YgcG